MELKDYSTEELKAELKRRSDLAKAEAEDEDVRKFMQYIEKQAKAYEFNLPNRSYDIYAFAKDILVWLEKQSNQSSPQTNERAWLYLVSDVLTWKDGIGQYLDDPRVQELAKRLCSEYAQKLYNPSNSSNTGKNEQKSTDKIEPRFKVGDWIASNLTNSSNLNSSNLLYIIGVDETNYEVVTPQGSTGVPSIRYIDKHYHLWTIQDAKDGDVLCCSSGWMCIFKSLNNHTNTFSSYCFMDSDKYFFNSGSECHTLDKEFINAYNGLIHPATKEQRDLLFQKIKEAGYKWNTETKTLEKLVEHKFKVGDRIRHKETNRDDVYEISKVYDDSYGIAGFTWMIYIRYQDQYELVPNKFDPKTLQPFNKVLVRDNNDNKWECSLFSRIIKHESFPFKCVCSAFRYCIPYNDDTKHLVGTTDEAPEFYKYWEN